jgi:hypothetical protein
MISNPNFVIYDTLLLILNCPNDITGFSGFFMPKSNFLAFEEFPNLSALPVLLKNSIP